MNKFYCAAPWRGLHINPRGDVKTCCAGDPNMLGNLNDQTIEQILNGPELTQIRETMSRGETHAYCSNCVKAERYGADSNVSGTIDQIPTLTMPLPVQNIIIQ
jgi:radical SAM protein with 4Fe4S-binding SPASM domain